MRVALIAGTSITKMLGWTLQPQIIKTNYGPVELFLGQGEFADLVFLPRHGPDHRIPPHRINYQANMQALHQLEVERVLSIFTVGSLSEAHPPHSISALDQFLDFTHGRPSTFFDGGDSGLVHSEMTEPFCAALRDRILKLASEHNLKILPSATYVCTEGPRFETAAEIRMFAQLGGDVVGMTGVPEIPLARELGLHYAALAVSINWGAGLKGALKIEEQGLEGIRASLLDLCLAVLRSPLEGRCSCQEGAIVIHPPSSKLGGSSISPKKQRTRPSILVSACLLGEAVRYDGGAAKVESPILDAWLREGKIIRFCPEVEGGCPIPRPPAEIVAGDGHSVLEGNARVFEIHGRDTTEQNLAGAQKALQLAQAMGIQLAILKRTALPAAAIAYTMAVSPSSSNLGWE